VNSPTPTRGQRPNCGLDHSSPGETAPADALTESTTEAPPPSEHGSRKGLTRFDAVTSGDVPPDTHTSSLQVARAGQADDGRGSNAKDPSEQPGTSAPELLPDREANVNRIRKAGHWASA
jgi:hypothetical protein